MGRIKERKNQRVIFIILSVVLNRKIIDEETPPLNHLSNSYFAQISPGKTGVALGWLAT